MARVSWFDDKAAHPLIQEQVEKLDSFTSAMADGVITVQELAGQEQRLVAATKSAHLFASSVPTSRSSCMQRAASRVAEASTFAGVSPAFAIISSSISSKYPWKRAGGPVSVPIAIFTPASDSFFRLRFATSR